jgi:hypothetical protein
MYGLFLFLISLGYAGVFIFLEINATSAIHETLAGIAVLCGSVHFVGAVVCWQLDGLPKKVIESWRNIEKESRGTSLTSTYTPTQNTNDPSLAQLLAAIRNSAKSDSGAAQITTSSSKVVRIDSNNGNRLFELTLRKGIRFYPIGAVEGLKKDEILIQADGKYFAAPKSILT